MASGDDEHPVSFTDVSGVPLNAPVGEGNGSRQPKSSARRSAGSAIAALIATAKWTGALLKVKFVLTALTAFVSVGAYALWFGWSFAVGFVTLLFIHEMGHVIALRREGIRASAPVFIPFLGAVVSARLTDGDAAAEARVGLAGPVLGSLGALVCVAIFHLTGDWLFQALAYTGFLLNLFNLMPVLPLDGGRAMSAVAPWVWFVGLAALIPVGILLHTAFVILIAGVGGVEIIGRWRKRRRGGDQDQRYYAVPGRTRAAVAGVYLALVGALAFGMTETHHANPQSSPNANACRQSVEGYARAHQLTVVTSSGQGRSCRGVVVQR